MVFLLSYKGHLPSKIRNLGLVRQILWTIVFTPEKGHAPEHTIIISHDFIEFFIRSFISGVQGESGKTHESNGRQKIRPHPFGCTGRYTASAFNTPLQLI